MSLDGLDIFAIPFGWNLEVGFNNIIHKVDSKEGAIVKATYVARIKPLEQAKALAWSDVKVAELALNAVLQSFYTVLPIAT